MNSKYVQLSIIVIFLALLYYFIPKPEGMVVWACFVMLAGLYYAKWIKEAAVAGSFLASFFVLEYISGHTFSSVLLITFFISVIAVPYYFSSKTKKEKVILCAKNEKLKEKYTDILIEHSYSSGERQKYEENIERIMQLYIIGRELSKNIYMEDFIDTVLKALTGRSGVISVSLFARNKGEWTPLAFSKSYQKNDWIKYMSASGSHLEKETGYAIIDNPEFCLPEDRVVFWPLKMENELLGCVLLVVEKAYVSRYVEEGAIIGPQLSLDLKRVNLFAEVSERSRNDGLTGLYLRRYFMERLRSEMQREKRYSGGFYILMMDIDYFKNVNDTYGHLAGDKVLCAIAKILVDCVRPGDLVARYGGEEFIVFMPMATQYEAREVAQEINSAVKNKKFTENDDIFNVTISIGISSYPGDGTTMEQIIEAADKALYKAKQSGRNKVVLYGRHLS